MDFEIEIDDDEVVTLTIDEHPKKKLRIQVESLTVRGKLPERQSRPSTVGECWPIVEPVDDANVMSGLHGMTLDEAERRQAIESVLLGFMRDHPNNGLTKTAVTFLKMDDFKFQKHQFVFDAIQSLVRREEDVSTKAIVDECAKSTTILHARLWIQPWFVDALGGDLDPIMCYVEVRTGKYPVEN